MQLDDLIAQIRRSVPPEKLRYLVERLQPEADSVAIVGIGCRYSKGLNDPESMWQFVVSGGDAVGRVPAERWANQPVSDPLADSAAANSFGAFLKDVDQFDPLFFGIAPAEAKHIDPQQRILLEVAWEALEDAGIARNQLGGSETGVYLGLFSNDYFDLQYAGKPSCNPNAATGTQLSMAAGRLAHWLDLHGPTMTVDTACSSSLTAIHLATQALRNRETDQAIAGGVQLFLTPRLHVMSSVLGMVSPTGTCRVLDAEANGFVHGEGCGIVVLKRLTDAVENGDRIYAVIRGSAANHDGRTLGLTAPNSNAQRAVIRKALASAKLSPDDIGYVELHGSGTPLGDPCEIEALQAVYGRTRLNGSTCGLGAVKTTIGHTVAAAGVAGVINAVSALRHKTLPPNKKLHRLNPKIALANTPFVAPTEPREWTSGDSPRRAAVSSFGASGTNVHVILEEWCAAQPDSCRLEGAQVVACSAPNKDALRELARTYSDFVSRVPDTLLAEISYTSVARRTQHPERIVVLGRNPQDIGAQLAAYCNGEELPNAVVGTARRDPGNAAIVFGDSPLQWSAGLAKLLDRFPPIAECVREVEGALRARNIEIDLRKECNGGPDDDLRGTYLLLAIGCGIARTWQRVGIEFDSVLSLGIGEVTSEWARGSLTASQAVERIPEHFEVSTRASRRRANRLVVSAECTVLVDGGGNQHELTNVPDTAENRPLRLSIAGRDGVPTVDRILWVASNLHVRGWELKWKELIPQANVVSLPSTPWQRQKLWAIAESHSTSAQLRAKHSRQSSQPTAPQPISANTVALDEPACDATRVAPDNAARLAETVGAVLGFPPSRLVAETSMAELGISSLSAMEIAEAISRDFGVLLQATALWRYERFGQLCEVVDRMCIELHQRRIAQHDQGAAAIPSCASAHDRAAHRSVARQSCSTDAVSPVTNSDAARMLANTIGMVLGIDSGRLGPDTMMSELGVSSLSALEIADGIGRNFGVALRPTALWRHETFGELLKTVTTSREGTEQSAAAPSQRPLMDDLVVARTVREYASRILGIPEDRLSGDTPLSELGITSLSALELSEGLSREFRVALSPTSLWRIESMAELVQAVIAAASGTHNQSFVREDRGDPSALAQALSFQLAGHGERTGRSELHALLERELEGLE